MPGYKPARPHKRLGAGLEALERGEIRRLIVQTPPQHGKSTLATVLAPGWFLGRHPDWLVACISYSDDLAMKHSRLARNYYVSPEFQRVFPVGAEVKAGRVIRQVRERPYVHMPRHSAHEWETGQGGGYFATGIGGGLSGRPMMIGIIDDPIKNRAQAESETVRNACIEWYQSTFYTRRAPGARLMIISTPWHPNDLAGFVLEQAKKTGDNWHVLRLPAMCAEYDALWPERYDHAELEHIHRAVGDREWGCQYMLEPTLRGGNVFKVDRIQWHSSTDGFPDVAYVRAWDLASSIKQRAKADPDWTVGPLMTVTVRDRLPVVWIRDFVAGQWEAPERDRHILEAARRDGRAVRIGVESVAGYKDTAVNLQRVLAGLRKVEAIPVSSDKMVRAQPLEAIIEAGNFHVLDGWWRDELYRQFAGFPKGAAHDDFVDGVSLGYGMIAHPAVPEVRYERFDAVGAFGGTITDLEGF